MGNLSGITPKWVSRDNAGGNPAYPDQLNSNLKLEKDLDTELAVFYNWKRAEAGLYKTNTSFSDGDKKAFRRIGRPVLVSISGTGDSQSFSEESSGSGVSGADIFTNWVPGQVTQGVTEYVAKIPYSDSTWGGHRKGRIKGGVDDTSSSDSFIIPKIKTYSYTGEVNGLIGTGDVKFEEVYDSAEVNIRTGEITLRADLTDPVYLVVIY